MAGLTIMLVSNVGETAERLSRLLVADGYGVDCAKSATEALAFLTEKSPDMAVVSDDVPDTDLLQLLAQIHGLRPGLPVVLLEHDATVSHAVEAMRRGAYHYAATSIPSGELTDIVCTALEVKRDALLEAERGKQQRAVGLEDIKGMDVIDSIMGRYDFRPSRLVGILQEIQKELRYLPQDALTHVAERLGVPLPRIYSVATFYRSFSLTPRGRHIIKVCVGTACHVRGAPRVLEELERKLGIQAGETTYDMEYTLLTVNCLGCCALGPVVVVDEEYHSVRPWQTDSILGLPEQGQGPVRDEASGSDGREGAA